ncbi:hypothetical protein NO932_06645 [Pelagibacterium sp. 26DY04]|uniref:hypothetical protein n=1 Tax=Pelagibacterium sp. 26DY04 TaxID=2967130 RepID=UPI0028167809|nr:hypothetical protein [Pelagibacterium sp. 26DY04]WMT88284.1 hypothetical protein NO932_06645 [Pelagibacterium sp. 26DY04]
MTANVRLRVLPRIPPIDGRQAEFQATDTHIQWRIEGDDEWQDLLPISDLVGEQGPSIELQYDGTNIQWRVAGEGGLWSDLVDVDTLLAPAVEDATAGAAQSASEAQGFRNEAEGFKDAAEAAAGSVVSPGDYGASEGSSGATNDAAFAAFEAVLSGSIVDLRSKTYPITTIPTGNTYQNGYWLIENYDETATVRIPAKNTINRTLAQITNDDALDGQPQDSWHSYNDGVGKWPVVFALWRQRSNNLHGGGEEYQSMLCRSKDGGMTWGEVEWIIPSEYNRQPFAAGQVNGQQFVIVRDTGQPHKLFGRRLYQRRELTGQNLSRGTDILYIEEMPDHGVKAGDKVRVLDWSGAALNGVTPDGEYTVAVSEDTRFGITVTGMVENAGFVERDFNLEFVEGPFTEILFGGQHLSDAVAAASGGSLPNLTTLYMHLEPDPDNPGGGFYTVTHGGGGNQPGSWMVRVANPLQSGASISAVRQISTYGVEASIRKDADGYLYTMIRSQENGEAVQFGWSDDEGQTWTLTTGPAYPWALLSGTAMVIVGDKLFATLSGARNATALLTEEGIVPMYLLEATLADLRSEGFDAFTITKVQDMYFSDGRLGEGSVTGVQSMVAVQDRLIIGYCSEFAPTKDNLGGLSDIFALTIELDGDSIQAAQNREIIPRTFVREPVSYRTIRLYASVNADGTIASRNIDAGLQLDVSKSSTGQYDFTFVDAAGGGPYNIATTLYYPQATCGTAGRIANWNSKGSGGFSIETTANGGALTDTRFTVAVDILR